MPSAIVIGAGPAGSLAALLLCRRGWSTTLVEQHRFPRDKVCGECLSALGIDVLHRSGLAGRIATLGPATLTDVALHAPSGRSASLPLPTPMWGISRRELDCALLDAAAAAGARILQPARSESLAPGTAVVRDLQSNRRITLEADWVIVADGKSALLRPQSRPRPSGDLGLKSHFRNVTASRHTIHLFGFPGLYGGLAPVENGVWNLALAIPQQIVRGCPDFDALLARLCELNPVFKTFMAPAARTGDWLVSPLPRFGVQHHWPERVLPIGNAAAAIEPIGGEGMGLALRSAELAAECLVELTAHDAERVLRPAQQRLWRRRSLGCRGAALLLTRPRVADWVIRLANLAPLPSRWALQLLGKSQPSAGQPIG